MSIVENKFLNIPVEPVKQYGKACLTLQGTILTYQSFFRGKHETVDMPVELVSVSKVKRCYGKRLFWALWSLVLVPLPLIITYILLGNLLGGLSRNTMDIFFLAGFILTPLTFLTLLAWFFWRVPAILITTSDEIHIEFYLGKQDQINITYLIDEIAIRKSVVQATEHYPLKNCQGDLIENPFKGFIWIIYFFALPGWILKNDKLFLIVLIPIIWFGYKYMKFALHPKLYRKAYRFFYKNKCSEALQSIETLISQQPDYRSAYPLYVYLLCRVGRFSEVETILSKFNDSWDPDYLHLIQDDLIIIKRFWKRKYGDSPDNLPQQTE